MYKYFYIFKILLKENYKNFLRFALEFIITAMILLITIGIWTYAYSGEMSINGYTLQQILWYVVFAEFIWYTVNSKTINDEIFLDIKNGKTECTLVRPYNYVIFVFMRYCGEIIVRIPIFFAASIALSLLIGGWPHQFSLCNLLICIFLVFTAMFFNALIRMGLSLSAFWLETCDPVHLVFDKIMLIFGVISPIEFLPEKIQKIVLLTPVFPFVYGPCKLFVNFSFSLFLKVFASQIIYGTLILVAVHFTYKKGVEKIAG
jgi:ABC-2 type transport system permease protein